MFNTFIKTWLFNLIFSKFSKEKHKFNTFRYCKYNFTILFDFKYKKDKINLLAVQISFFSMVLSFIFV